MTEQSEPTEQTEQTGQQASEHAITHDQEPTGEQGITTDKPGVDPGGYPHKASLPRDEEPTEDEESD